MSAPGPVPGEGADSSVGELIGQLGRDVSTLVRQELALARAELAQEAKRSGRAAGAFTGAAVAGWFVALFASVAVWAGLSAVLHPGWAALLVALVWAVVAGLLYLDGRSTLRRIRADPPDRTTASLGQVPNALTGRRRGGTP
ncbi:phage holin family protein [Pseudonocardia sp. KRD291]|uniref:phage holin family protein n=1 Tax=Pseudonocardia sp. KRD291 TaxID=2792007 RepID=UPI001C49F633|nr:phage holin family protein [Pseudonocardia sp. KRD291]MBW0106300.1 phage holin family protein [Pseudonocardia sp. KRD291]